jgi:glycosyltransferase involved in cell wall biosynthesis
MSMTQLRIGIDGYNLAIPTGTGVATYGMTLAHTLKGMGHQINGVFGIDIGSKTAAREALFFERFVTPPSPRKKWLLERLVRIFTAFMSANAREVPLTGEVDLAPLADRMPPFERIVTSTDLFVRAYGHFRRTGRFTSLRMKSPPDVMHWTYPVPVWLEGSRNVYTLHDLVPLKLPYTSRDNKPIYRALVQACVERADHICTVSETSRTDIIDLLRAEPAKVTNTYQISPMILASQAVGVDDSDVVKGVFGLEPGSYFLYYGAVEPKKNIGRLIEAYLSTRTQGPLVIVSGRGWHSDAELFLLPSFDGEEDPWSSHLNGRVRWINYLPRRLLLSLIRCARAVTFPSIYEGFGLPVHEAMLLGTPVLAGNTGAIREVAGDAALLVDPLSVDAIRVGLQRLSDDEGIRRRLSIAGSSYAQQFSQTRYATALQQMYAQVLR